MRGAEIFYALFKIQEVRYEQRVQGGSDSGAGAGGGFVRDTFHGVE